MWLTSTDSGPTPHEGTGYHRQTPMAFHCIRCKKEIDRSYRACPFCGEQVTDFARTYADQPIDGKYRLVDRLGAGGMGDVYKAEHVLLGNMRVIKVIRPQISGSQDAHERFLREARAATRVQHQNVATLHDFASLPDGSHYMVWEFIDGENLAQRTRLRGPLPPRYAIHLIIQALAGLDAIHRAGIVHRDLSPENLMVLTDPDGSERVKIIDLGVAKLDDQNDGATRAGVFVGKLRYASPEQLGYLGDDERIDGRADLFSIAMVLYELVSGRPPFEATSPHEYVMLHSREREAKPPALDGIPGGARLQTVLEKALARDRTQRYANAREFAAALETVMLSLPDQSAMRTMNVGSPFDGDSTMRVTPPPPMGGAPSDVATAQTIRTPLPADAPQLHKARTVAVPQPSAPAVRTVVEDPPPPRRSNAPLIITLLLIFTAGVGGTLFYVWKATRPDPAVTATTASASIAQTTGTTATSNLDVVPPAAGTTDTTLTAPAPVTATETTATTATAAPPQTATTAPPARRPAPPPPTATQAEVAEETPQVTAPAFSGTAYIEGGDSDANEAQMESLKRELSGVSKVSILGAGDGQLKLAKILRNELSDVTIGDGASVVIHFEGMIRPLGRGRKERSATATITKNGRAIFRYRLGPEAYRIGDTPAEAFSRVLLEGFDR